MNKMIAGSQLKVKQLRKVFHVLTFWTFFVKLEPHPMKSITRYYPYFYYYGAETQAAGGEA